MGSEENSALFRLDTAQLCEVARLLRDRVETGLSCDGSQIACIPTYVPRRSSVPDGEAAVLDLGGTNLRAARVCFAGGRPEICSGPEGGLLPIRRGEPLPRTTYLAVQAEALLKVLAEGRPLPLGYCFSYPASARLDGDATLIRWTKGVDIPGVVGEPVGALVADEVKRMGGQIGHVVVVNDTVAALYASLAGAEVDGYIGLIVGTGTNMATFCAAPQVPKLSSDLATRFPSLPINLESGNFAPAHLNRFDEMLDASSENPGFQRFEKAVSGAYLGRLFALAMPSVPFDKDSGAQGVVELLERPDSSEEVRELARAILDRSSDLVAASLAGLCLILAAEKPLHTVRVLAEGSLFWKAPGYESRVRASLDRILLALGLDTRCCIVSMPNANLIGTAIASLAS